MRYEEWAAAAPETVRADPLWRREDYRLALFIADEGWDDVRRLTAARASSALGDQLSRSLGSIGANIAEGHGRSSGADRARFYEYALGSARESRDWYHRAARTLGPDIVRRRLRVLTSIARLLASAIPDERGATCRTGRRNTAEGAPRVPAPRRALPAPRDTQ